MKININTNIITHTVFIRLENKLGEVLILESSMQSPNSYKGIQFELNEGQEDSLTKFLGNKETVKVRGEERLLSEFDGAKNE